MQGIQQLAASYALPLVTDAKGSFVLEVGRVTENGVDLVLPGFKACDLSTAAGARHCARRDPAGEEKEKAKSQ